MTRDELIVLHLELCIAAKEIMTAKNIDYAGGSDDPFVNFSASNTFGVSPGIGILIRILDKLKRMETFIKTGNLKSESFKDSVLDVINYMVLLYGMMSNEK